MCDQSLERILLANRSVPLIVCSLDSIEDTFLEINSFVVLGPILIIASIL